MAPEPLAPKPDNLIQFANPEALSESERLLAANFNSPHVGLCILDSEFRYVAVNETLAVMNGTSISRHLGKTIREILGDFADRLEPELRKCMSSGTPVKFEISGAIPTRHEPGDWLLQLVPIKDNVGAVTRIGAVVLEVTAQKKLEKSLQTTREQLQKEVDRFEVLTDITRLLSANWDLRKVFPQISARIRRILRQEYATLALRDPVSGMLVRQATDFPLGKGYAVSVPISATHGPAGKALEAGTPIIFSKDDFRRFDVEITKSVLAEGLQSLCCVPLLRPKGALGVFVLGSTRSNAFREEDLTLLDQVAAQLAISLENHRVTAEIESLKQRLSVERKYLEDDERTEGRFDDIVGESPALKQVLDQVLTVAPSDATVLILGETGTGKELVARALHRMSHRSSGPFVKLNCAAIPTGLLESELFGHEKGAFTGAISQKVGRLELADGGTLFLDEIGEIPLDIQPKLLRVLQDHEFERLGATRTIKVNLRLIAATNRDLSREVADRRFRTDLFYRLNVFPIRVPPLRERSDDIPLLVRYFVRKFARRMQRHIETIPTSTMTALVGWSWPGNIRELENLMERSVILSDGSALKVPLAELRAPTSSVLTQSDHTLDNAEREHIIRVLRDTRGVLSGPEGAARRLGLKRTTLQSKMQRLKINRSDYLGNSEKS